MSTSLRRRLLGEHPSGWGLVLPASVLILGLNIGPMVWAFLLSLRHDDLLAPSKWVGLANYRRLAEDPVFRAAIGHTLNYTALFVPLSIAIGLGIAMMLNQPVRFAGFYRTCVFVPFVVSAAAEGALFSFVFDPHYGVANAALARVGIGPQGFFQDPRQAMATLVAISLWGGIGLCVVVLLAALQDVPTHLVEAARLDGAGRRAVFRHVTLPAITPVLVFLLVWQTLQALQLFELVYTTTNGGPLRATTVVVFYVYQQAFQQFDAGYGAAVAYVVAVAVFGLAVARLVLRRMRGRAG
ncbi:sugar ABC transporter permease [Solihabitans fulvus]|uniref:Sugar ABC transporter permease n=1 Tax=Solihabitans fulvus TaxID=1892852 RepID=A0A5B2XSW9_9PSEU|nr:sugar ABC transporter permease [Solihabitans fulvus]KAA2267008.1 sugar ABC transporter permease [Solihabitans fulvus]